MPPLSQTAWLMIGAVVGYALMMGTNPVRACLRDGWRAVRRYPSLWLTLGMLGFAHAVFSLGTRVYLASVLPPEDRPVFLWMRAAWRDPKLWLTGSPESLWWLPTGEFVRTIRSSLLPSIESLAGLFDNLVSTFPLVVLAAPLLLLIWRGRAKTLWAALHRRFGKWAVAIYLALTISGLAAIAKVVLYGTPQILPPLFWMQWGQVIAAGAFGFEYLLGILIQVFLLLLAYAWVRGLNFATPALIDVALRRFVCVLPWSALVLLLSVLLIEVPLMLKNFPTFAEYFPEQELFARRLVLARLAVAALVLAGAGLQITLALHVSSLRKAWKEYRQMLVRAWWPLAWFVVIAFFHFFVVTAVQENIAYGVGEGTALWIVWRLLSPWLFAGVAAWLLASWVCVYQRFGRASHGTASEEISAF